MRHTTLLILTLIFVVSCSSSRRSRSSDASSSGAPIPSTDGSDGSDSADGGSGVDDSSSADGNSTSDGSDSADGGSGTDGGSSGSTGSGDASDGGDSGGTPLSSCGDIYTCTQNCDFDPNCADSCITSGSDKAQALYSDLVSCVNVCVKGSDGVPEEESSCLAGWCNDELLACQEDTGEPGFCGDGYCMDYEKQGASDGQFVGSTFCWQDCGTCGDDYCAENENFETTGGKESDGYCVRDCGFCGDGVCYFKWDEQFAEMGQWEACADDCYCGDGICMSGIEWDASGVSCTDDCDCDGEAGEETFSCEDSTSGENGSETLPGCDDDPSSCECWLSTVHPQASACDTYDVNSSSLFCGFAWQQLPPECPAALWQNLDMFECPTNPNCSLPNGVFDTYLPLLCKLGPACGLESFTDFGFDCSACID
jgi:hypothetical protein